MNCNSCGYGTDTMMHARLCAEQRVGSRERRAPTDAVGTAGPKVTVGGRTPAVTRDGGVTHECPDCGALHPVKRHLSPAVKQKEYRRRKRDG